jgi:hypothetical protein
LVCAKTTASYDKAYRVYTRDQQSLARLEVLSSYRC